MKRTILAAAVAVAPLLAVSAPAVAQVTISGSQSTPVTTATANNGQPANVIVSGNISVTAPGTDLTLDSNNTVSVTGTLGAQNQNNTVGLDIVGGFTGSASNSGAININESYTPPADPNHNGLNTGAFAQGSNRVGILVSLPSAGSPVFVGGITNTGAITVQGNNSEGVSIQAPISGDFLSLVVTPATTPTGSPTIANGSISVTGQNAIGLQITPTGGVGGNMRIVNVSATGPGAQALELNGAVGGFLNISGAVVATGYRTTSRQTNPFLAVNYSQMEMQQGGAAVTLGGNVGAGFIVSATPPILSTTNLDLDADGVPDTLQGNGAVVSFGASPAIQVGAASGANITVGAFTASHYISPYNANTFGVPAQFGMVIQGQVLAQGLFDQLTSPNLLAPVSATAIQIGGPILITPPLFSFDSNNQPTSTTPAPAVYGASGQVNIVGGLYNSGTISAASFQADATGIHLGAGANVPTIYNDGAIFASSTQVNSATTVTVNGKGIPNTPAPVAVNVVAIQIDAGANIPTITNNSGITAELTGTGGVGGFTAAIVDKSGTLSTVNNAGSIAAILNQTSLNALMPISSPGHPSNTVAIDMSAGTGPQAINQQESALATAPNVTAYAAANSYTKGQIVSFSGNFYVNVSNAGPGLDPVSDPGLWRQIGSTTPTIQGDIYMGSGPDTLSVTAGTVIGRTIAMGGQLNTVAVNGTATNPANVTGAITQLSGGTLALSVNNGTLIDLNPALAQATHSINVGATGVLNVTADPLNNRNTQFVLTGPSATATIASGGQIGLSMASLQTAAAQNYIVIAGAPGSITAAGLGAASIGNTPFLYTATAAFVASDPAHGGQSEVQLTVDRKTAQQLGFNAAEASAFNAVLGGLSTQAAADQGLQSALLAQTTQTGLKSVYDQLLPNQGQGIFQALDAAVERVSAFVGTPPDNATHIGGSSLWVQEVNERVERSGIDTLGSKSQLFGVVGGYERMGAGGGALGVSLGYFNVQENDSASQLGSRDVASLIEGSVYYRRSFGNLTFAARGGGGFGWFSSNRIFAYLQTYDIAQSNWTGAFIDGHVGLAYEVKLFGGFYARPEVSLDYLDLHQGSFQEAGATTSMNLHVTPHNDTQFSGQGLMVLGRQWGKGAWFRSELRLGYREVIEGQVGDTTASFANGTPFTLAGDPDKGGWATVGFSLKTGSEFSYLALEGDADFRKGQRRYDLRVAGRSVF